MIIFENKHFNGKTWTEEVKNKRNEHLGWIRYYPAWRKYVFNPAVQTTFDEVCLDFIAQEIKELNEKRKGKAE